MEQLKDKAIKFKGSDYVQVKDRILYLAEKYEGKYSINTDYQYFPERKMRVVKATLTLNGCTYTGLAQEIEGSSFINTNSALENTETSAVGRCCAMAGIGVIDSIASMDEINKANNRAVKSPKPISRFQKAMTNIEFMKQCLDEDHFITQIKSKYELDEIQEQQLRNEYQKQTKQTLELPFN